MKVNEVLVRSTKQLEAAGIGTARLDCLVLLEDTLNTNRTQILAQPERKLTDEEYTILCIVLEKRANHIPLAYIRQKTEFYGREFYVDERVLEPRPESETMISLLRNLVESQKIKVEKVIDIGTGSGALAITAKLELPAIEVIATDIDKNCLAVARRNAKAHHTDITFKQGDLLTPLSTFNLQLSTLLCNLPYVPDSFHINTAATHEPERAIFGGIDGLNLYRKLFNQIDGLDNKPLYILTESMPPQHHQLATEARKHGYVLEKTDDFIQLFKIDLS